MAYRFPSSMENRVILVAEDNEDDVMLLQRAFRRANLQADLRFVNDGEQAMAYLKGEDKYADRAKYPFPAFLVLDIKMPKMNGLEVLEAIRDDPRLARLTVIILTSSAHERDVSRASDLHANCYVVKPSDNETLMRVCQIFEDFWLKRHRRGPCSEEFE